MNESDVKTIAWAPSILEGVDALRMRAQWMRRGARAIFAAALLAGLVGLGASMLASPADAVKILQEVHLPGDLQARLLAAVAPAAPVGSAIGQVLDQSFSASTSALLDVLDGPLTKFVAVMAFLMGTATADVKGDPVPGVVGIVFAVAMSAMPALAKGLSGSTTGGTSQAATDLGPTSEERLQRMIHQPGLADLKLALQAASADRLTSDYVLSQASLLGPGGGGQRAMIEQARGMADELAHAGESAGESSAMRQLRPDVLYALETRLLGKAVSKAARQWQFGELERAERWRLASRAALGCMAVLLWIGLISGILALVIASRVGRLQFLTTSTTAAVQG